jgi:hypothetical protein
MPIPSSPPTSLFSEAPRTRTGPAPYNESEYTSLDRSARPYAAVVRDTLDGWFHELPDYARGSIYTSFASRKTSVHRGGLLELYLHETFRRLELEIDTDIGREEPVHRRPDFLLASTQHMTWVEATAVLGDDVFTAGERRRVQQLYDLLNQCRDKRFLLLVEVEEAGSATLGRTSVLLPLERWLAGLEPLRLSEEIDRGAALPELRITPQDWTVTIKATPVEPNTPPTGDKRVMGSTFEGFTELDDTSPLRRNLKRKASHYGALDAPYIIAVLCAGTFIEDNDIAEAMLGDTGYYRDPEQGRVVGIREPNGFWNGPGGPVNTRVSAVLTIPRLSAETIAIAEPTIWTSPWAKYPLTLDLPWRQQEIQPDGRITTHKATISVAEVLGLPPDWPHSTP